MATLQVLCKLVQHFFVLVNIQRCMVSVWQIYTLKSRQQDCMTDAESKSQTSLLVSGPLTRTVCLRANLKRRYAPLL